MRWRVDPWLPAFSPRRENTLLGWAASARLPAAGAVFPADRQGTLPFQRAKLALQGLNFSADLFEGRTVRKLPGQRFIPRQLALKLLLFPIVCHPDQDFMIRDKVATPIWRGC